MPVWNPAVRFRLVAKQFPSFRRMPPSFHRVRVANFNPATIRACPASPNRYSISAKKILNRLPIGLDLFGDLCSGFP